MAKQVSKGFHEIENTSIARKYTTPFSVLKSLKRTIKTNNKSVSATAPHGASPLSQPTEKLLPSQQKRLVRTFTTLESGQQLQNTELNRKDVKRLGRFGFLKSYYQNRPSAAIDTANRLSERAMQSGDQGTGRSREEERKKVRVRQVERRLEEERTEHAAVSAARTQYARTTSATSVTRSSASHSTAESRDSAASSISAVLAQSKPSVEVEKSEPAMLPPEPVDDGSVTE